MACHDNKRFMYFLFFNFREDDLHVFFFRAEVIGLGVSTQPGIPRSFTKVRG